MDFALECKGLTKWYGNKFPALNQIDLQLEKGRIIGLLGPNGSGKTTLMKLCNGLLTPTSGEVRINGLKPGVQTKRVVSYLPERTYLADWMTAGQAIDYFKDFYANFNVEKAEDMLRRLGINRNLKIRTMSKGTREKVQLMLVMSREAGLYLLDEPIGGVDPATRDYILDTIITNYHPQATVVICTHLIHDVEKVLDEVVFLHQGRIALQATVKEIQEERGTTVDALFREVFRC
ncbi:MAG: ABC transporter ATP-binding protein [Oscillospiraceae bacterium]|nr:ABC transporter ATP-binding protein [Oscillospiraceae bacterium]